MIFIRAVLTTLFAFVSAQATGALPDGVKNAPSNARWHKDYNFTNEIDEARELLSKQVAGFRIENGVVKPNVILAVKGVGGPYRLVKLAHDGGNDHGFAVGWEKLNGMNTPFMVAQPEGFVLLGIKRGLQLSSGYGEFIYTPFTVDLDTPAMREAGMKYLQATLGEAYRELARKDVRSLAYPGHALIDVMPTDVALVLSLIEHIDPTRFVLTEKRRAKVDPLVNEVLVTVAANRSEAYKYARSPAGARGLFQFMPGTYRDMVEKYPRAGLNPSFVPGMDDHLNAAQASLLLFDSDLSRLPWEFRKALFDKSKKRPLARYAATAYNGGAGRAISLHLTGNTNKLRPETRVYLRKLEAVAHALNLPWANELPKYVKSPTKAKRAVKPKKHKSSHAGSPRGRGLFLFMKKAVCAFWRASWGPCLRACRFRP